MPRILGKKRAEVLAAICVGLIIAYFVGYFDGARQRPIHKQEVCGHE